MQGLSTPAQALATRILQDVTYEQRLTGYRRRPRWGQIRTYMYSFKEVALLLKDKYPMISLSELESWLRTVMGDVELAERVAEAVAAWPTERERLMAVGALLDERLAQCRQSPLACP